MVCANCGSGSHRTNHARCTKHCTLCRADGHRQKTAACRFRECSKCKAVGHSARECTGLVNREAESSFESSDLPHSLRYFPITVSSDRRMNDAERCSDDDDADATACAMHVEMQLMAKVMMMARTSCPCEDVTMTIATMKTTMMMPTMAMRARKQMMPRQSLYANRAIQ